MSRRIALISGVTGQDGSYLAADLLSRGWDVHGLVRPCTEPSPSLKGLTGLTIHTCDLSEGALQNLIRVCRPEQVFHLAGFSSVWKSWEEPVLTTEINASVTARILEACLQLQDSTGQEVSVVNASSAEIYAGSAIWPQNEETAISPISPYGVSKALPTPGPGLSKSWAQGIQCHPLQP